MTNMHVKHIVSYIRSYFAINAVCIGLLVSLLLCSAMSTAQTADSAEPASTSVQLTTSATISATPPAKPAKPLPSKALRIFLETRNVIARPEGYETLLTIDDKGAMTFEWHTVSGKRKILTAQLKPKEWKELLNALQVKKFMEAQPTSIIGYADWMQSLAVEKDEQERTIRMMIDYKKRTPEAIDKAIQEQLGEEVVKDHWKFIALIRAINDRFRWSGQ